MPRPVTPATGLDSGPRSQTRRRRTCPPLRRRAPTGRHAMTEISRRSMIAAAGGAMMASPALAQPGR
ncbi:hypothetical protein FV228_32745 [Methylobacterium sp. WL18]|nr:hypothetical protein FV228_32745 [Methylobacterium sp. WL18]